MNYPEIPRYYAGAYDIRTSYYMTGQRYGGIPILMLHGMSTSADSFREIMHELGQRHWVIAPDIPGFGYSDNTSPYTIPHLVEWLADLQWTLNLPAMTILGHSFGGILATSFALAYPQEVEKLLLLAPAILTGGNYPELLKKVGIGLGLVDVGSAVSQSKLMVKRQIKVPFYDAERFDDGLWERRLKDYELARASSSVLKATAFYDIRSSLDKINQPTCLVWGQDDPVVPDSDADVLAEVMPDVVIHKFPECGHLPMIEQQENFLTVAQAFLAR
ncbi:MAG: alpha/beta hydrolase [Ardenticatenaceae bacterium]|nr:alpha/beta hydrolase [Ardenticatenaceae bacterium]